MLYWDAKRRLSVAMVTNNSLAPDIQQRLQRAIVAFASGRRGDALAELSKPLPHQQASEGSYRTPGGEIVTVQRGRGPILRLTRRGVTYDVYPLEGGIGYAPGLDVYLAQKIEARLQILSLYEDQTAERIALN
jgi:hypothetical protein